MHVFLIAALTADGFIGRSDDHKSTRWTSKEDAAFFQEKTKKAGVVIMGRKTYETIGKPLPGRLNVVYSRQNSALDNSDSGENKNLQCTQESPEELLARLEDEGHSEVAICGGASIYTLFLENGLVDTLYLTIEPVLFGDGVKLFNKQLNKKLQLENQLKLSSQTIVLEYSLNN